MVRTVTVRNGALLAAASIVGSATAGPSPRSPEARIQDPGAEASTQRAADTPADVLRAVAVRWTSDG